MDTAYLIAEYNSLRAEIMQNQERRVANERYGAAATVAVYAWLATQIGEADAAALPLLWFGWWLPFLLAVFGYFRHLALSAGIRKAGRYLADMQRALDIGALGWERRLADDREAGAALSWVSRSSRSGWIGAMLLTWVVAVTATGVICGERPCGPTALNELFGYEGAEK